MTMLQLLLVLLMASLPSCAGFGASPSRDVVLTDGSHQSLPAPGTKMMVWTPSSDGSYQRSEDQATIQIRDAVTIWLQKHGMVLVGQDRNAVLSEQQFRLMSRDDRVRVGQLTGVQQVVFQHLADNLAHVTLQAVDVESGEVVWIGSASTPAEFLTDGRIWLLGPVLRPPALRALACHALRTAWGLEPPARYALSSKSCWAN